VRSNAVVVFLPDKSALSSYFAKLSLKVISQVFELTGPDLVVEHVFLKMSLEL
jgi:hypothetical protein